MGTARGERQGDRGTHRFRGETVAALAELAATAYADHADALRGHLAA